MSKGKGILYRWGLAELAGPIAGVVLVTIGCFTLLSNRELNLRRQQMDLVTMNGGLLQARAALARGYLFYVLYKSGDSSVRAEQVISYLDQSINEVDSVIAVRNSWRHTPYDAEFTPQLVPTLQSMRQQLSGFRSQIQDSLRNAGGPEFELRTTHQLLIQQIARQHDLLMLSVNEAFKRQDTVVRISIGIWAGSLAGVLLLLVMSSVRRSRIERALRESEQRFRATFNQAAVGIAHVDTEGRWLLVNDTLCRMLGYSSEEMQSLRFQDITHVDDLSNDLHLMHRMLAGEIGSYSMEKRYICKSGSILWVNLTVAMVRNEDGSPSYFISVVEDINDRKRVHADRDELLERERKARTDAESANRAKDHFLAVVSHELRTPLTPVTTGLDLLSRDPAVMTEHGDTITMMRRNVETESQIISDLLDVVRLSNNKLELRRSVIDLHRLLRDVEQTFRVGMNTKRIRWRFSLDAGSSLVKADPLRMTQVFTNLLGNAMKFTPEDGCITVSTRNIKPGTLRVEVQDDGIGIEPHVMQRLFQPFEQAEISLARHYGGLGLGLSIARGLLELHGGTLSVSSDGLGKGACFAAELPVTVGPLSTGGRDAGQSATQQKRILVVEDNADTAQALTRLLKSLGHQVTVAQTGADGLEKASAEDFDLLLSDIGLPDFSGWEMLRRLKEKKDLPAIALSGFGSQEDQRRSREAGFLTHLVKPVDVIRLENAIAGLTPIPSEK